MANVGNAMRFGIGLALLTGLTVPSAGWAQGPEIKDYVVKRGIRPLMLPIHSSSRCSSIGPSDDRSVAPA